jgi:DNA replication licensing factor MCM4
MRYNEVIKAMEAQSSLPIDTVEFAEVVRALENEGAVKVSGDREKRTIRRTAFGKNDE